MKNVFFALAFMLAGTFAFANNSVEKTSETKTDDLEIKTETTIIAKKYLCSRTCYYRGGELQGCTSWSCTEIIELDEVVVFG